MTIGANIKRIREELRMTQEELAVAAGYTSRSSISKIENGDCDPTQRNLVRIALALGVRPADLLPSADEQREADVPLSAEEFRLVAAYRNAKGPYKEVALELLITHPKEG